MMRATIVVLGLLLAGCDAIATSPTPVEFVPPVQCIAIPVATCQEIVDNARTNADPGSVPVHIRATCTRAACTLGEGDVSVEIQYSNGRRDAYGMGWSGPGAVPVGPPAEVLPVEPVCQGVPADRCRELALEAVTANDGLGDIRSIVVRCAAPACTALEGEGETRITLEDGSTTTSSWGYQGGG